MIIGFIFLMTTGDSLDVFQMKKATVKDYLISGNAYLYINRQGNKVKSLHYVDEKFVTVLKKYKSNF